MYISTCCLVENDSGSIELIGKLYLSKDKQTYIDFDAKEIVENGKSVSITPITYNVLECLIYNYDRIVTRDMLIEYLWPNPATSPELPEQQINNSISALRNLKNHKELSTIFKTIIETKHGMGYKCQLGYNVKILRSIHKKSPCFDIELEFASIPDNEIIDYIDICHTTQNDNDSNINKIETIIESASMDRNLMECFYNILIDVRNSLREANESAINLSFKNLQDYTQKIYYIAERYKYSDKPTSELASLIVEKYNAFVTPLNNFVNSKNESEDIRNKNGLEAEQKFYELVDLILRILK